MTAKEKLSLQRFSVLELAKTLNNVSKACRRRGISRTQFYEYRRRFLLYGMDGLKDLPPIHHHHPWTTSPEVIKLILVMSLEHPGWSCITLSDQLKLEGVSVSSPTIQNILIKNGMGRKYERLLKLEELALQRAIELTPEQSSQVRRFNPCYREIDNASSRPGELLAQRIYYIRRGLKDRRWLHLHIVVDTYSSYAFGLLQFSNRAEAAVAVLQNDVIPFYRHLGLNIQAIVIDQLRDWHFTESDERRYDIYLAHNEIERQSSVFYNGFIARFHRTVSDEFLPTFRAKSYKTIGAAQNAFDGWLLHYNTERAHEGYRNMGKRPMDAIQDYIKSVRNKV